MSFKTERRFKMKAGKWSIQKLIYTAMLAAVAGVLMSLEFSVPMMLPFYKCLNTAACECRFAVTRMSAIPSKLVKSA